LIERGRELIGIFLLNLGGPDSLKAVRPFLYNLFSDREIIRLGPSFLQKPIAWIIAVFRAGKSKTAYTFLGGKSPIRQITEAQAKALEKSLNASRITHNTSRSFKVYIGMRYWHPFIKDTVQEAIRDGIRRFIVLSMYPQYSKATTGSAVSEFKRVISKLQTPNSKLQIKYIKHWYNHPLYIDALAENIYKGISAVGKEDVVVLFSAHSMPEDFIKEGDPYVRHTEETIKAILERLKGDPYHLEKIKWHFSFQSRSGPVKWLKPSTDETIVRLANEGVKRLCVVPVSFVSDHVETIYEIGVLYRELAIKHGIHFIRCPSLNVNDKFIDALKSLVMEEAERLD
jgi:ferrochelatase